MYIKYIPIIMILTNIYNLHTFTKVSIEGSILARATFSRNHIAHIFGQAILTLAYYG